MWSRLSAALDDLMGLVERPGVLGNVLVNLDVTGLAYRHKIVGEFMSHSLIGDMVEMEMMTALAAIARILAVLQFHLHHVTLS